MNYDRILEDLGEFGPWQLFAITLLIFPAMAGGIFVLTYSFTGLEPEGFRCAIPYCDADNDFDTYNSSIYVTDPDGKIDYCETYTVENNSYVIDNVCPYENFTNKTLSCDPKTMHVIYQTFDFESTVATEFNLVCGQQAKVALVGSIYMSGLFFGSFIFGYLGDRYGRKISLMAAILVSASGSLAGAFVNDLISYCITRFITAVGSQGVFLISFGLSVELVGNKRKTLVGNLAQSWFAVGEALVGALAYAIRDWRTLQIVLSAPVFAILGLYFILPESPRWLIATKRYDEAKKLMEKAAKWNKKTISPDLLEPPEDDPNYGGVDSHAKTEIKLGTADLFKNPTLLKNLLVMFVAWIVVTLGYYGISLSATSLNSDKFVSSILTSLVEIPSYIFCTLVMDSWGRKPIFSTSLILTGVACIPVGLLDDGNVFKTFLPLVGKFGASAAFSIVYLYTAELFPTAIRSTATGLCSMMARIGGIAAPQVAQFLPKITASWVPFVVLGGAALVGGVLSLLLPETLGSLLPETIADVEALKKNSKSFFSCWSRKRLLEEIDKNERSKLIHK